MSNSDKKLNGGGGRSNPITLNAINEKVRTLEGTTRVTPIKMSDLNKRINNLGNQNKSFFQQMQASRYSKYNFNITTKFSKPNLAIAVDLGTSYNGRCSEIFILKGDNTYRNVFGSEGEIEVNATRKGQELVVNGYPAHNGTIYLSVVEID